MEILYLIILEIMSITPKDIEIMKKSKSSRFYKWWDHVGIEFVPTWLLSFDHIIWWWIPRWRIVHIFGKSWSGKTSLALHIAKKFENIGEKILFIDAENTFPEYIRKILDIKDIDIYEPSSWEDAVDAIVEWLNQKYGLIILDSVAVCTPMSQLDQSSENNAIGLLPKLMAKLVKLTTDRLSQNNATLILLNHEKDTIGGYKGQVYAPAQWTILFAASLNVRINSTGKSNYILDSDTNKIALKPSRIQVLKSKVKALHDNEIMVFLDLKWRFSETVDMLIFGMQIWVISKNGAFIKYWDTSLWQWILKAVKMLIGNNELNKKITTHILDRVAIVNKQDDVVFSDDVDWYNDMVDEYNDKYTDKITITHKVWIDKTIEDTLINKLADKQQAYNSLTDLAKATKKSKRTVQRWKSQWLIEERDDKFYLLNI